MSALRLFQPAALSVYLGDDFDNFPNDDHDQPVILRFPGAHGDRHSDEAFDRGNQSPLERARLLRLHRECPDCGRAGVVPREANQAIAACATIAVPGASPLLGFGCDQIGRAHV